MTTVTKTVYMYTGRFNTTAMDIDRKILVPIATAVIAVAAAEKSDFVCAILIPAYLLALTITAVFVELGLHAHTKHQFPMTTTKIMNNATKNDHWLSRIII